MNNFRATNLIDKTMEKLKKEGYHEVRKGAAIKKNDLLCADGKDRNLWIKVVKKVKGLINVDKILVLRK